MYAKLMEKATNAEKISLLCDVFSHFKDSIDPKKDPKKKSNDKRSGSLGISTDEIVLQIPSSEELCISKRSLD